MPELTIFPFVSCLLTIALVYKYLTPLLSGGNVALKKVSVLHCAIFSFVYALAFTVLYFVAGFAIATAITPFVKDFVNSAEPLMESLISVVFRGIVFQSVFFALTLFAGKFCKSIISVNGVFNAWRAAWAPAVIVIALVVAMSELLRRMLPNPY
jgi:hypothetical protein